MIPAVAIYRTLHVERLRVDFYSRGRDKGTDSGGMERGGRGREDRKERKEGREEGRRERREGWREIGREGVCK